MIRKGSYIRNIKVNVENLVRFFRLYRGHNSSRCFCVELVNFFSCINIVLICFHMEYWVLSQKAEYRSRRWGLRIVAFSINSNEKTQ